MNPPAHFDHGQLIRTVVLVGLGGTGSQWARILCRTLYDLKRRHKHLPALRFVDPDRIESRNVGRQMFLEAEIGLYKAECLARRFSLGLGLNIEFFNEPFDAGRHADASCLVCGAVDNHLARAELARCSCLYIDSGNHAVGATGQVIVGNTGRRDLVEQSIESGHYRHLPHAGLLFPTLLEPEVQPEVPPSVSCADLQQKGEQHLLINDTMGIIAGNYSYKLLNYLPVTTFATFVDADSLTMRSLPVGADELRAYLA